MICYLIRHGKDDDTVRGGWSAAPLTEQGISQVEELADIINGLEHSNKTKPFSFKYADLITVEL